MTQSRTEGCKIGFLIGLELFMDIISTSQISFLLFARLLSNEGSTLMHVIDET